MNRLLRHITLCALTTCALSVSAQQDRNLILHFNDKTTQTIALAGVDSITFEKKATDSPVSVDLDIHTTYVVEKLNCTDPTMHYYVSYLEKDLFNYSTDEEIAEADKTWMTEMATSYGMGIDEMVEMFTYTGEFEEYQDGLLPGHEYIVWAHGMDSKGNCTTPVTKILFRAKQPEHVNGTISLKAEKTADGIKVACSPDDKTRPYTFGSIIKSKMVDEFTGEPLGTHDYMQTGLSSGMYDYLAEGELERYLENVAMTGDKTLTFGNLQSGVEYYIVAAYLNNEAAICSDITQIDIDSEGNVGTTTMVKAPQKLTGKSVLRHARKLK